MNTASSLVLNSAMDFESKVFVPRKMRFRYDNILHGRLSTWLLVEAKNSSYAADFRGPLYLLTV